MNRTRINVTTQKNLKKIFFFFNSCAFSIFLELNIKKVDLVGKIVGTCDKIQLTWLIYFQRVSERL